MTKLQALVCQAAGLTELVPPVYHNSRRWPDAFRRFSNKVIYYPSHDVKMYVNLIIWMYSVIKRLCSINLMTAVNALHNPEKIVSKHLKLVHVYPIRVKE